MITKVDHENFHDEVYHHDGPVVVTFGFNGCAPCRQLAGELNKLADTGVKVVKVDIEESGEIATHFKVSSVPTTLFFARGEPRISWTGVTNFHNLKKQVAEAVEDGRRAPADHVHA
jgi:thioredoxin-like negative regulator of GroEL